LDAPPELSFELKKRKKFEPTSIALPAASASSMAFEEVMPLLPSAAGQSLIGSQLRRCGTTGDDHETAANGEGHPKTRDIHGGSFTHTN